MTYFDGPTSHLIELSRIFEQIKQDQLSSSVRYSDRFKFYYYIRSPKDARKQEIPPIADKQINLIKKLAPSSGFSVSELEYDTDNNKRLLITVTDDDRFFDEYNKFANIPTRSIAIAKLKQAASTTHSNATNSKPKLYDCHLSLVDVELKLKIGKEEHTIGRLLEDKAPHKLMAYLSTRSPGTTVKYFEIFPSGKHPNLWQIMVKSKYSYLRPFFKGSGSSISYHPDIKLTEDEVSTLLSKVIEKYRKNFKIIDTNS